MEADEGPWRALVEEAGRGLRGTLATECLCLALSLLAVSLLPLQPHEPFALAILKKFQFPKHTMLSLTRQSVFPAFFHLFPRMPFLNFPASLFTWFILSFLLVL